MNLNQLDINSNKTQIIQRALSESYELNFNSNKSSNKNNYNFFFPISTTSLSSAFFYITTSLINTKDYLKFNIIKLNSNKLPETNKSIQLFNKNLNQKDFNIKIKSILYFSYRKNFTKIRNSKTKDLYTSDCGWGCMIRSGQMIFSRAIYKIFKHEKMPKDQSIKNSLSFFLEYPYYNRDIPLIYADFKKKILTSKMICYNDINRDRLIHFIFPPFSIKTICTIGEIFNKTCGEWFSDVNMPNIFKIINENFEVLPKLKIFPYQSLIIIEELIKGCFEENEEKDMDTIEIFNKNYKMKYYCLVFVSVRLGLQTIAKEYYESIKELFNCKQNIGFIGGKDSSASYFIGYNDYSVIYLDPHYSQESIKENTNDKQIESTYLKNKTIYSLRFENLQTALTIGFLARNINEFKSWLNWLEDYNKKEFPCFKYQLKNKSDVDNVKMMERRSIKDNKKDDF